MITRSLFVVAFICLFSTVAFAGGSFNFEFEDVLGAVPGTTVEVGLNISGGGGQSYSGIQTEVAEADDLTAALLGSISSTATISGMTTDGTLFHGALFEDDTPPTYGAAIDTLIPTVPGTLFKLFVEIPLDAVAGETYTLTPDKTELSINFPTEPGPIGDQLPGVITVIPEPSGVLIAGTALLGLGLRRRAGRTRIGMCF